MELPSVQSERLASVFDAKAKMILFPTKQNEAHFTRPLECEAGDVSQEQDLLLKSRLNPLSSALPPLAITEGCDLSLQHLRYGHCQKPVEENLFTSTGLTF